MPLKTFKNLPESRQKEIRDACLEEFAFYDYGSASLNRIIEKLGIAKGSFYRYFTNKEDLYRYLIEYGKKLNLELFNQAFEENLSEYQDIFAAWIEFYLTAVRLDNQYPLFSYFGYKVSQDRNNPLLGDVHLKGYLQAYRFLEGKVKKQQKKGKIRRDLDERLIIYILVQLQSGFLDWLTLAHGINFKDNIKNKKPLFTITEDKLKKELQQFAKIMREGMGG